MLSSPLTCCDRVQRRGCVRRRGCGEAAWLRRTSRLRRGGGAATSGGAGRDGAAARRRGGEIVGFASLPTRRSSTTSRCEEAASAHELADKEVFHCISAISTTTVPHLSIATTALRRGHGALTATTTRQSDPALGNLH